MSHVGLATPHTLREPGDAGAPVRNGFARLYRTAFLRPRAAFDQLVASRHAVRWGVYGVAVTAAVYLLVYWFLAHNGGRPDVFMPWLAIEPEVYYRYNLLLVVPSLLLAWVAAAGFTQLVARALGGDGSFEQTAGAVGLSIGIASWATGLHDVVTAGLGYLHVMDQRAYEDAMNTPGAPANILIWTLMALYLAWFVVLFTVAVRAAHGLGRARALATGAVGFVAYQLVFAIFNR